MNELRCVVSFWVQTFLCDFLKMGAVANMNYQYATVLTNVIIMNDFYYLKGALACSLSGPADGGKPKWATLIRIKFTF